jgi:acyl-CoA thioesterase I
MRQIEVLLILAALTIGMSGCKSDPPVPQPTSTNTVSPAPQPVMPSSTKTPDNRPLLVCFGDSLTAGYGADPGDSYPDYLQADLEARGYHYRVVNEGISGNTTKDAVARLDHILALKPAVIVVELGGNDGLRGLPIADSRANLDKIVATLKASGAKVALAGITLPPDYGPDYIKQFDATYTLLAKKYHVPMLPFLLQGVYGVPGMMQADQTHATAAGNKIVARNVLPLVLPLLKK